MKYRIKFINTPCNEFQILTIKLTRDVSMMQKVRLIILERKKEEKKIH